MKPCKNCGNLPQHCSCHQKEEKQTSAGCQLCGVIHKRIYLANWGGMEICHDCLSIKHIPAEDLVYYKQMSEEYNIPLTDIPVHVKAANRVNMPLPAYLLSLPRTAEEFKKYFAGKNINIGGVKI